MTAVYIETTIPSFYFTAHTDHQSIARMHWTRQWWDTYAEQFTLYSSPAVVTELSRSTRIAERDQRISLLDNIQFLEITPEVREIVRIYVERLLMPKDAGGDALHLALASHYGVDVLLTWNCKHLANPNKFGHIQAINAN